MENKDWRVIYVAGGCFWGIEGYFQQLKGVIKTEVGYANGDIKNPTYQDLVNHRASHAETVKIVYDDNLISLEKILEHFLRIVDPFTINRQGHDVGLQYRSGVYFVNNDDEATIRNYFAQANPNPNHPFVIEVAPLANFYRAEEYHQDYLLKNPAGYCHVDMRKIKKEERK